MEFPDKNLSGFDRVASNILYQLLLDLKASGSSDIYVDPRSLLSSQVDTMAAINRSAALEKEAQEILKVFTSAPVTPVVRGVSTTLNNPNERALVPRNNVNFGKRSDNYKIDIWKENNLVTSIENHRANNVPMHFINIKIEESGEFIITGLENVNAEIKEIIRELGGMIAIEDAGKMTNNENNGVKIREITDGTEQIIEVPLKEGIVKFYSNQNPIDVLSEIYCTEETNDNKKIFKIPKLGDFVVSPEDDPIQVFKAITGYDLTDYYKNCAPDYSNSAIEGIPDNSIMAIEGIPNNSELAIDGIPEDSENKENEIKIKNTRSKRHKKNKQKRKSKKRK